MSFDVLVMQAFSGISLFTILVLMALGLAIIFGLMGVINMAHGEIMALGAYVTYLTASVFEKYLPSLMGIYVFFAIAFAFLATFVFGWLLERSFIRFLYNRPLDTLLATWGLSLVLQQTYRSVFGAALWSPIDKLHGIDYFVFVIPAYVLFLGFFILRKTRFWFRGAPLVLFGLLFRRRKALKALQEFLLGHALDGDLGVVGIDAGARRPDQRQGIGLRLVDFDEFLQ